jgi:hypothetical protein
VTLLNARLAEGAPPFERKCPNVFSTKLRTREGFTPPVFSRVAFIQRPAYSPKSRSALVVVLFLISWARPPIMPSTPPLTARPCVNLPASSLASLLTKGFCTILFFKFIPAVASGLTACWYGLALAAGACLAAVGAEATRLRPNKPPVRAH